MNAVDDRVLARSFVEGLWGHVDAVWPRDCPAFTVHEDLREEVWVAEWLEDAVPLPASEPR